MRKVQAIFLAAMVTVGAISLTACSNKPAAAPAESQAASVAQSTAESVAQSTAQSAALALEASSATSEKIKLAQEADLLYLSQFLGQKVTMEDLESEYENVSCWKEPTADSTGRYSLDDISRLFDITASAELYTLADDGSDTANTCYKVVLSQGVEYTVEDYVKFVDDMSEYFYGTHCDLTVEDVYAALEEQKGQENMGAYYPFNITLEDGTAFTAYAGMDYNSQYDVVLINAILLPMETEAATE